jgi:hypothetical protein
MVDRIYGRILPSEGQLDARDKWGMTQSVTLQKQEFEERYSTQWEYRHQWLEHGNCQMD